MSSRTVSILVLGGALLAGLAACDSTGPTASQPTTGSPTAVSTTTTTTPPSDKPVQVSTSKTSTSKAPSAGCPVTTDTLLTVLKDKYHTLPAGQELRDVKCYQDYAIAGRFATGSDSEVVTFHYASGSWQYFVGGSGGYCEGVPAMVKKHFGGAGYPGCS